MPVALLLFLAAFPGASNAENWIFVATSRSSDTTWHLNTDSLRAEGGLRRAWLRLNYASPKYNRVKNQYYSSELQSIAARCGEQTLAVTAFSEWSDRDAQGTVVGARTYSRHEWNFEEGAPGTIRAAIIRAVCAASGERAHSIVPIRRLTDKLATADWFDLGMFGNADVEVDLNSISKLSTGSNRFSVVSRARPQSGDVVDGRRYTTYVQEIYVGCDSRTWSLSAFIYFDSRSAVVRQDDIALDNMTWHDAQPDTLGDKILDVACAVGTAGPAPTPKTRPANVQPRGYGTAWLSDQGYLITAHHVVEGANKVNVIHGKKKISTRIVATDSVNDVAILEADFSTGQRGLPLERGSSGLGARVFTLGYPHPTLMGVSPKLTAGEISSTSGLRDDPRLLQISAPVQAGNSGGPLLSMRGTVVGLVSSKLSATQVLGQTGDLTQNVNYAVKIRYIQALLQDLPARHIQPIAVKPGMTLEELAAHVRESVFIVVAE